MAAAHGKNGRVYLNGNNISSDLKSVGLDMSMDVNDISTMGANSRKYLEGLFDATLSADGVFDRAANGIDKIISDSKGLEAILTYYPGGTTAGNPGYGMKVLRSSYGASTSITQEVNFAYAGQATEGEERITSIADATALTADGSSPSYDTTTGGADGGVLYFNVSQITSAGDLTVKLQDSADDIAWADVAGSSIADVNAIGAQRIAVTGVIRRYVKITIGAMGGGETITFQAGLKIN
jgi:hypothetical protein